MRSSDPELPRTTLRQSVYPSVSTDLYSVPRLVAQIHSHNPTSVHTPCTVLHVFYRWLGSTVILHTRNRVHFDTRRRLCVYSDYLEGINKDTSRTSSVSRLWRTPCGTSDCSSWARLTAQIFWSGTHTRSKSYCNGTMPRLISSVSRSTERTVYA